MDSNFGIIFLNELHILKIGIVTLGLTSEVEEAFVLISTRSSFYNLVEPMKYLADSFILLFHAIMHPRPPGRHIGIDG